MSQEALALESGVDRSYLSEIERGLKCPTLDVVEALASSLGILGSELIREAEASAS